MRAFGFVIRNSTSLRPPVSSDVAGIPAGRLSQVRQSFRRRLDDDLEAVFKRACLNNDPEAAADLLALLEKWHARRVARFGRERPISDEAVQRARSELERLNTLHGLATRGVARAG